VQEQIPTDHGIDLKKWCVNDANRTSRAKGSPVQPASAAVRPARDRSLEEQALQQRTVYADVALADKATSSSCVGTL